MSVILHCDRCGKEINSVDEAMIINHDTCTAWMLQTLKYTAMSLLSDADNDILCEQCTEDFKKFMGCEYE